MWEESLYNQVSQVWAKCVKSARLYTGVANGPKKNIFRTIRQILCRFMGLTKSTVLFSVHACNAHIFPRELLYTSVLKNCYSIACQLVQNSHVSLIFTSLCEIVRIDYQAAGSSFRFSICKVSCQIKIQFFIIGLQ